MKYVFLKMCTYNRNFEDSPNIDKVTQRYRGLLPFFFRSSFLSFPVLSFPCHVLNIQSFVLFQEITRKNKSASS